MTAKVIGLGGRLRAGKEVVAERLEKEHGFKRLGMSDAPHEALLAIDPIVDPGASARGGEPVTYPEMVERYGYVEAKKRPEVRRLLQALGTEVGRNMIGENVWVNIMARKIDDFLYADRPVVITGIRFPNELTMIHQFAGKTVWVERPTESASAQTASHASENSVGEPDFDVTLLNDSTLDHLEGLADRLA